MWRSLELRKSTLAIASIALITVMANPTWAGQPIPLPTPGVTGIVGLAIITAIVVARRLRRK